MSAAPAAAPGARPSLRRVLVPTEHGGWSFLAEPVLLGLLVAFSPAGVAIALAALAAFLARQPLKLIALDRGRRQRYPRTALAERALAACVLLGALALAGAALLAGGTLLLPLALAAPVAALALALDLSRRSREAPAELAAAIAMSSAVAAIAIADGCGMARALGLWGILAARAVPTILYVRARLRLDRRQPAGVGRAVTAHALAVGVAVWLAASGVAPWAAAAAIALLALRCGYGLSPARPALTTPQLGISEAVFGAITVLATAWGALHMPVPPQ